MPSEEASSLPLDVVEYNVFVFVFNLKHVTFLPVHYEKYTPYITKYGNMILFGVLQINSFKMRQKHDISIPLKCFT